MFEAVLRQLDPSGSLSDEARQELLRAIVRIKMVEPETDLLQAWNATPAECVLLDGYAYSYKLLSGGRRQILSFNLPGQVCGLQTYLQNKLDHSVRTLTSCKVGFIQHATISEWLVGFPDLTRVLWRSSLLDGSIYAEWLTNVARRTSEQRIAHLLCELFVRLEAIGLREGHTCLLPPTQLHIADSLGLTPVHVSRILGRLRGKGLIERKRHATTVLNWPGLVEAGDSDPAYLQSH